MKKRIAVIGGGWAGISAAIHLIQKGFSVTLFEAGKSLGGRAKTLMASNNAPPWAADNGQHLFIGAYFETFALMKTLNINPADVLTELPLAIFTPNLAFESPPPPRFLPAIFAKPWQNLRLIKNSQGLNDFQKKAAFFWFLHLKKRQAVDEPVDTWLSRQFQKDDLFAQEFLKPLCQAALNTDSKIANAALFQRVLCDAFLSASFKASRLYIATNGLSDILPLPALQWFGKKRAPVFLGCRILKMEKTPANTWILHYKNGAMHVDFDAVVLATAPAAAKKLLASIDQEDLIPELASEPVATIYLYFQYPLLLKKGLHYFDTPAPAWVVPQGEKGVAIVLSAHGAWEKLWERSSSALAEQFKVSIEKRQKAPAGNIVFEKALKIQNAATSARAYLPNRPAAGKTQIPNLYLAGDYTFLDYPSTLESAVLSGKHCANAVLHDFPR